MKSWNEQSLRLYCHNFLLSSTPLLFYVIMSEKIVVSRVCVGFYTFALRKPKRRNIFAKVILDVTDLFLAQNQHKVFHWFLYR